jgi:hypothetical protein
MALHTQLNNSFKEMGDLVNWSNEIESDLESLVQQKKDARQKLAQEDQDNKKERAQKPEADSPKPMPVEDHDLV